MAISFIGVTSGAGSNPSLSPPAGTTQGDLLILVTTGGNTAAPSGWTQLAAQGSNQFTTVLYKFATSSESSVSTGVTSTQTRASLLAYRGAGAIETIPAFATGTGTTATPDTVTTTYANDFVVSVYTSLSSSQTWTANASTTARVNSSASATLRGMLIADELQAATGVSTARAATLSTSKQWAAFAFALIETRTVYWVGGTGTWDTSTRTNWSNTSGGAGGVVVPSQNDAVIVDASSGTPTITIVGSVGPPACASLTTTGATCEFTGSGSLSMTGNLTLSNTTTWSNSGTLFFLNTATITTNGVTIGNGSTVVFNGTSRTFTLGSDLTISSTSGINFVNGTLNLNTFSLSTGSFSSTGTTTRSIAFGTGAITCTGSGGTLFDLNGTSFTYTGTPTINISNNSATATTVTVSTGFTAANALDFNYTTGTYALTDTSAVYKSVNWTGFAGTVPNSSRTIYGDWTTPASDGTYTGGANAQTFAATSGTQTITSNGRTFDFPVTKSGASTLQLADALTLAITRTLTLTAGTLVLNNFTATAGLFSSSNTNSRVIVFGTTGAITVVGSGIVWDMTTVTNFSYTGTSTVNISNNSATATTVTTGTLTEAQALNFNYTTGSYTLTNTSAVYKNVNFTGFAGTVSNATRTIYGDWTNPASGITWTGGALVTSFSATTGTQTFTSNLALLDFPITKTGAGTLVLGSQLAIGTTRTFSVSAGTFTPGFNVGAGLFSLTGGTVNMGSLTWTASGTGAVWTRTSATISAGTSTIELNVNSASAMTFAGGGAVYNNLSLTAAAGTGTLTITGANTFNTLASSRTGIYTITLPASATTTVATWSVVGTSAATNYFTLNSSTAGTRATLSDASGTVNPGYAKIQDIATTGGATFTATTASNLGNNTGWTGFPTSKYWIDGSGAWDTTTTTDWALSSGGTGGNFPPSLFEDVFFDGASGSGTVTLTGASTAKSLTTTGSSFTFSSTGTPTIAGDMTLSATTTWSATGLVTFTGTGTITTNGIVLSAPITFNGTSQTFTLGSSLTTTGITTLTAGTIALNGFDATCLTFSGSGSTARGVTFGSNYINITGTATATVLDITTATAFTPTGTGGFKLTGNALSGVTRTIVIGTTGGSATTAPNVWVSAGASGSIVAITTASWVGDLNFTGSECLFTPPAGLTITGSLTAATGMQWTTGTGTITFAATATGKTITTAGKTLYAVTFNGTGGGWTLQDAMTLTNTLTLTAGSVTLNGFDITCLTFSGSNANVRSISFGSNYINITSTATATSLTVQNTTNFTPSGTGGFKLTGAAASGITRTITIGTTGGSVATAPNVWVSAGASGSIVAITTAGWFRDLNFTGYSGTWATSTTTTSFAGSLTLATGMTFTAGTGAWTFAGTSGLQTIDSAGKTFGAIPITINNTGTGVQLLNTLTSTAALTLLSGTFDWNNQTVSGFTTLTINQTSGLAASIVDNNNATYTFSSITHTAGQLNLDSTAPITTSGTYTFTAGTLNLNNLTLSCSVFSSNNSGTRQIQFGTGAITTTGSGTVWNVTATGAFSITGTPTVNISNPTSTATSVAMSSSTEANAINFNFTTGTYALSLGTPGTYRSMNFTGFAGSWSPSTTALTIYGSITLVAGMTYTTGTGLWTLAATTGTQTITSAAKTLGPITQAGAAAQTVAINGALTMASTATYTLTLGTLDLTNGSAGNYALTAGLFSSTAGTRAIAFGTGSITTIGSGTAFSVVGTGLTYTGTPTINISNNSATATTVTVSTGFTETNALSLNYTTGTYTLTDTSAVYKSVNWTGFAGTLPNSARTIYGDWTNPATDGTYTGGANAQTFAATSGTQTITGNGRTLDFPITKNAAGALVLGSALGVGVTRTFSVSAGTFTPGHNITAGLFSLTGGTVNMDSLTWTASGTGSAWSATAATISAGTSTIVFSDTSTTTKTFAGGGKTYNNLQIGGVTGTASYIITGANTFNTVSSNKTVAYTITLPASTITTVSAWTAGGAGFSNRLTLNSSTAGTQTTLALAGGGIAIGGNFMSIQDINFTPEASGTQRYAWYVGENSTFGTNVSGGALLASLPTQIGYLLTTGTEWTVPADWSSYNNQVYLIGGGGGGSGSWVGEGRGNFGHASGAGGGGGGFRRLTNVTLTPGSSVTYTIGSAGTAGPGAIALPGSIAGAGGSTTFNSGAYVVTGGGGGLTTGSVSTGGAAGTGETANGGAGGNGTGFSNNTYSGGGGGGAGGIDAAGIAGGAGGGSGAPGAGGAGDGNVAQYIGISPVAYGDGATGAAGSAVAPGVAAKGFGGGGSGAGTGFGSGNTSSGGVGTQGVIFVLYTQRLQIENFEINGITIS